MSGTWETALGGAAPVWRRGVEVLRPAAAWCERFGVLQSGLLVLILSLLVYDRYRLCQEFLFKYTDEDQTIMWLAAHDLLEGKLHEPCFFGQDYNSCIEGYLAAPLIAAEVPYHVAVPLVSLTLGLLPFLLLAWGMWRRGQAVAAGVALLVPLILPVRYAMITGMPRGFVTGLGFAAIPMLLLLPARRGGRGALSAEPGLVAKARGKVPRLMRTWPAVRYFAAGAIATFAIQLNPNCLVLLVPVAVYAMLTSWREWKFWVFGLGGILAVVPYFIYVYQFYHVYHTDYPTYLRGQEFTWSFDNFERFYTRLFAPEGRVSLVLPDLVPMGVAPLDAVGFTFWAFALVGALLLVRMRVAALLAGVAGVALVFISFGYSRVNDIRGSNSVSFALSRMYVGLPIFLTWLMVFIHQTPPLKGWIPAAARRWGVRGALAGLAVAGLVAVWERSATMAGIAEVEFRSASVAVLVPVDLLYATASEVQRAADAHEADLVVVGTNGQKYLAYGLPCLTTCDSLLGLRIERRTWRIVEESYPGRHEKMLLISISGGTPVAGGHLLEAFGSDNAAGAIPAEQLPGAGGAGRGGRGGQGGRGGAVRGGRGVRNYANVPVITMVTVRRGADGKPVAVNDMLRTLGVGMPPVYQPAATAENPNPSRMVERSDWGF